MAGSGAARSHAFDEIGKLRQSLPVVPDKLPVYLHIAKLLMQVGRREAQPGQEWQQLVCACVPCQDLETAERDRSQPSLPCLLAVMLVPCRDASCSPACLGVGGPACR